MAPKFLDHPVSVAGFRGPSRASTNFSTGWRCLRVELSRPLSVLNRPSVFREAGLFTGFIVAFHQVREARGVVQKGEIELADGAVTLLGDNDFGTAFEVGVVLLV